MAGVHRPSPGAARGGIAADTGAGSMVPPAVAEAAAAPVPPAGPRMVAAGSARRQVREDADPVWRSLPGTWADGPFLGSALLGSGIHAEPGANAIRFDVRYSRVQDHHPGSGSRSGPGRLPAGWFTLEPAGTITGVDWRLSLRDAELTGTVTTGKGTLAVRAMVHSERSVLVVEITASPGEQGFRWVFHPAPAACRRAAAGRPARVDEHDGTSSAVRPLPAGGEHVTSWHEMARGSRRTLYATAAHSARARTAQGWAVRTVRAAAALQYDLLALDHRARWLRYRTSHCSGPDTGPRPRP